MPDAYAFRSEEISPSVWLHHLPSKKLKTNRLQVVWVGDVGEDITERALLPSVLVRGTRSHPSYREVNQHLEWLFGTGVSGDVSRLGGRHVITLRSSFVNDRFIPGGEAIFDDVIEFLSEAMHDPHLVDGRFPAETVDQEKINLRRHIEGLINDKSTYAAQRLLEVMCPDEPYSHYEYGSIDALDSIDAARLTDRWREVRAGSPVHIYTSGDLEWEQAHAAAVRLAGERQQPRPLAELPALRSAGERREVVETLEVAQTNLLLGYRTGMRYDHPHSIALTMANGILGQFAHSKLFQNVREKASLCYSVHSSVDRSSGLMTISSGISEARRAEALEVIEAQVKAMCEGDFTEEELSATRLAYDNRLRMIEDSPGPLMNIDLNWRITGAEYDHESYRRRCGEVTRDEIVEAIRQVELDTVYALTPAKASE